MHESMGESDQFMRQVPVKVQGEGIPSIAAINLKGFCQYNLVVLAIRQTHSQL